MSKVATGEKKYILIPEAYPLHAFGRVYGPSRGPLRVPTPAPIKVIGELLHQTGKEKVTISEVIPMTRNKQGQVLTFSEPVRLTLENYTLPYEDILAGKTDAAPNQATIDPALSAEPVAPEMAPAEIENAIPVVEGLGAGPITVNLNPSSLMLEKKIEEAPAEPAAETVKEPVEWASEPEAIEGTNETTTAPVAEEAIQNDPWPNMTDEEREAYQKMSKTERKAARRAHREQASEG